MPDREISSGFQGISGLVEQHIADPAAEDDAEHGPEQEIVDRPGRRRRRPAARADAIAPAGNNPAHRPARTSGSRRARSAAGPDRDEDRELRTAWGGLTPLGSAQVIGVGERLRQASPGSPLARNPFRRYNRGGGRGAAIPCRRSPKVQGHDRNETGGDLGHGAGPVADRRRGCGARRRVSGRRQGQHVGRSLSRRLLSPYGRHLCLAPRAALGPGFRAAGGRALDDRQLPGRGRCDVPRRFRRARPHHR